MQGLILEPNLDAIGSVQYRNLVERYGFDPFLIMPPNGQFFDLFSSQTCSSSGGTGLFFSATLGPNEFARISGIGMEADAAGLVDISDMVFQLRVNSHRHRTYGAMSDQIGTGQSPTEVMARIFEPGSLLEFQAVNNDTTNNASAFGRVQGWTIPH